MLNYIVSISLEWAVIMLSIFAVAMLLSRHTSASAPLGNRDDCFVVRRLESVPCVARFRA